MTPPHLTIYMAADSWGFSLYEAVKAHLLQHHAQSIKLVDLGVFSKYYLAAHAVGLHIEQAIVNNNATIDDTVRGILICGSGQGMAVVANKFKHCYATLCTSVSAAQGSRAVNNSNILTMGARVTDADTGIQIVDVWLSTPLADGFEGNLIDFIHTSMPEIDGLDFSVNAVAEEADAVPPPTDDSSNDDNGNEAPQPSTELSSENQPSASDIIA